MIGRPVRFERAFFQEFAEVVTSANLMTMKPKRDTKEHERFVPAGEFKAKCLALFDQVETSRKSFVVTKRGRPVARVVPMPSNARRSLLGSLIQWEARS
jgi:prevent-host-death family protein